MKSHIGMQAFVAAPGEGKRLGMAGLLRVSTAQTGGAFEIVELDSPRGPLPHVHHDREECFYVIEGVFTFMLGKEQVVVPAGSVVLVPRGTRHAFTPGPGARALAFSIPGGLLEDFFQELLAGLDAGRPEAELRAELAGKYDAWPSE